jgi:hypothetical protein
LIKGLKDKVTVDEADPTSVSLAKLIFETAMIESGFQVEDTKSFSDRVYELAKDGLGLTGSLKDIEEVSNFDCCKHTQNIRVTLVS